MNSARADRDASAWEDPATQSFLRPKRIAARIMAGWVIVFIVVSIIFQSIHTGKATRLAHNGVHTSGVIVWIHSPGCKGSNGPLSVKAAVRFNVAGVPETHTFNTQCREGVSEGATVPVDYDPANPKDFAVSGRVSENPTLNFFEVLGGAAAFASVILAIAFTIERASRKRLLEQTAWIPTTLLFVRGSPIGRGAPSHATILNTPEGQQVFRGADPNHRVIADQPLQILEVAGNKYGRRAVRQPGGRRIIFLSTRMSNKVAQESWNTWHALAATVKRRADGTQFVDDVEPPAGSNQ